MPFEQLTPRTFTTGGVQMYAPSAAGVYGISNAREWVYIGQTDNIQGALLAHLRDGETSSTPRLWGSSWDLAGGPGTMRSR